LAASCACGAYSTSKDTEVTEKFRLFGEYLGISFQIKDDLFDYGVDDVGKPLGIDIKEKKMTLPLIYTLNNVDAKKKKELIYIVKNQNTNKKKVAELMDCVRVVGGIEYASKKMIEYQKRALEVLETFPDSDAKVAMLDLVKYISERKK
jgi:octaprenyl-diphosphate synthase